MFITRYEFSGGAGHLKEFNKDPRHLRYRTTSKNAIEGWDNNKWMG